MTIEIDTKKGPVNAITDFRVPLMDIDISHDFNARKNYDREDGKISELAALLKAEGQISPVGLIPHPNPKRGKQWFLVAGFRRVKAAELLEWSDIAAHVIQAKDREAYTVANMMENENRLDLLPYERAARYCQMSDSFKWTATDTAKRMGKSESYVGNLMRAYRGACPELHNIWRNPSHKLFPLCTTDTAVRLAGLTADEQRAAIKAWDDADKGGDGNGGQAGGTGSAGVGSAAGGSSAGVGDGERRSQSQIKEMLALVMQFKPRNQDAREHTQLLEALEWSAGKRRTIQLVEAYASSVKPKKDKKVAKSTKAAKTTK